MSQALEIVNAFYDVSLNRKDADGVRQFLADDFTFVGPLAQTSGADAFVELNRGFLPAHVATRMKQQFAQGDQVCSIYELDLRTPSGAILTTPMADWVKVQNGRMVEQHIYYDAREFEKQMAPATPAE